MRSRGQCPNSLVLHQLFQIELIDLIGSTHGTVRKELVLAKNLFGSHFDRPVMPVNPKHRSIQGVLTFETVASLPLVPDLTPPAPATGVHELAWRWDGAGGKAGVCFERHADLRNAR